MRNAVLRDLFYSILGRYLYWRGGVCVWVCVCVSVSVWPSGVCLSVSVSVSGERGEVIR